MANQSVPLRLGNRLIRRVRRHADVSTLFRTYEPPASNIYAAPAGPHFSETAPLSRAFVVPQSSGPGEVDAFEPPTAALKTPPFMPPEIAERVGETPLETVRAAGITPPFDTQPELIRPVLHSEPPGPAEESTPTQAQYPDIQREWSDSAPQPADSAPLPLPDRPSRAVRPRPAQPPLTQPHLEVTDPHVQPPVVRRTPEPPPSSALPGEPRARTEEPLPYPPDSADALDTGTWNRLQSIMRKHEEQRASGAPKKPARPKAEAAWLQRALNAIEIEPRPLVAEMLKNRDPGQECPTSGVEQR